MSSIFWTSYVALWILVAVLSVALVALYQHFAHMYFVSREGRAQQGPEVGSVLSLPQLDVGGQLLFIPAFDRSGLLVFAETGCEICTEFRTDFERFVMNRSDTDLVVVCGGGTEDEIDEWAAAMPLVTVARDPRMRLALDHAVGVTPFVIAYDEEGRVRGKGLVNGYDGLVDYAELVARSSLVTTI